MRAITVLVGLFTASALWAGEMIFSEQIARVDDQVVVSGLLDLEQLRNSHAGEVMIVDMRTEGEGAPQEAEAAAALGLGYRNIPISSVTVDPGQVDELKAVLDGVSPQTLVVVHCVSGNRAGMMWGAAALGGGESLESVIQSLEGVLTKQPAIDGLEAYSQTLNVEP